MNILEILATTFKSGDKVSFKRPPCLPKTMGNNITGVVLRVNDKNISYNEPTVVIQADEMNGSLYAPIAFNYDSIAKYKITVVK